MRIIQYKLSCDFKVNPESFVKVSDQLIDKKRTYISGVENDGRNRTLKTWFDIVEKVS